MGHWPLSVMVHGQKGLISLRGAWERCWVRWEDMGGLWSPLLSRATPGLWASLNLSFLNCELNSQQLPGGLLPLELAHRVCAPCTVCIALWPSKGAAGRWAGVCQDPQQHGLPGGHAEHQHGLEGLYVHVHT